jgi:hypothetical protein
MRFKHIYICSLIVFNSFVVLYLMCCFGNNPLYMDFTPIKIMFCSVLYQFYNLWVDLTWGSNSRFVNTLTITITGRL